MADFLFEHSAAFTLSFLVFVCAASRIDGWHSIYNASCLVATIAVAVEDMFEIFFERLHLPFKCFQPICSTYFCYYFSTINFSTQQLIIILRLFVMMEMILLRFQ